MKIWLNAFLANEEHALAVVVNASVAAMTVGLLVAVLAVYFLR
jgi:hypothetical protein